MGRYAPELRDLGYEKTEQQSPFDEDGTLWTNAFELVCDETASVIRKGEDEAPFEPENSENDRYEYQNSGKVKLYGGFTSSYEWGKTEDGFTYERR